MRSAFGVEHGEFAKGMKLPSGTRVRFRSKVAHDKPLFGGMAPQRQAKEISARVKGKTVGNMRVSLYPENAGEIKQVETLASHRRQGVATGMLEQAKKVSKVPVRHSKEQTAEGAAWAKSQVRKGFRLPGRLKPNEFWHGTKNADSIRQGGFKLADPTQMGGAGRTGRQITRGGAHGPGVYATKSKRTAKAYGKPIKVAVDPSAKFSGALHPRDASGVRRSVTTPQAAKHGFQGVGYKTKRGQTSTVIVGNPKLVKPV